MIEIYLAGPVRGKGRPRFMRKTGHAYTPKETVNYEAALRMAGQEQMAGRPPLEVPLRVVLDVAMDVPASWSKKRRERALQGLELPTKKPDVDNILKMLDGLSGIVWRDDAQIVSATINKRYWSAPGLSISVYDVTP
jgi:Holliday junction resolvase RusA-like endonuclease